MNNLFLSAKNREILGKGVRKLRSHKLLPAILYGHGIKNLPLTVEENSFQKVYEQAGESSLVDLAIGGKKPVKVLIQAVQTHPVSGRITHVDFHQVKMTEEIHTEILIKFIGESPAVKEEGGVLVKNLDKISVECLPQDLVHEIEVDLSNLKKIDDIIRVKDLNIPSGLKVQEKGDEGVVTVVAPKKEEEVKKEEEAAEPELVGQEKKEGEEIKEGEGGEKDHIENQDSKN